MESDRDAVLTIQSAVAGLINYRETRLLDPRWWRRYRILINAVERESQGKAIHAALQFDLALVSNGSLTEESFEKSQESAKERYYDLLGAYRPWEGKSYKHRKQDEFRDARQAYIDNFGVDPLDPKFKAWESEQIRRMESGELDGNVEEDEETKVTRKLQERILQRGK